MDISVCRLEADDERPAFDCGDKDLNEFFHRDSKLSYKQLLSVTYVIKQGDELVGFFSVSNDVLMRKSFPRSTLERIIPRGKRYLNLPSVKIGRLATDQNKQSQGIGTKVLDFMKHWFINNNKTGCRFIIVDAYNNKGTTDFYIRNDFIFLRKEEDDGEDKTRLMYFDLLRA